VRKYGDVALRRTRQNIVNFVPTGLPGAFVVELELIEDERGFFARSWCQDEFAERGLDQCVAQCNISFNRRRGTLRGMHFQAPPHGEAKLVRCTEGAIHDVIVDLRSDSPTYCRWISVELTALNRRQVYVPDGFAHGFQTLEDGSEVYYQMSRLFQPSQARGVRWNDPVFGISWPLPNPILSERDRAHADFQPTTRPHV
jgi:dTDP-4-dehydrorhamnose 3,5-epimerase